MSLSAGARLGPYEIVAPLGAGGMGEVYRARDGRLNRTVAIKILSDESAADADRRERFEREAKAISALDHPNICPLYDVGDHEGTYFLVMPCLEGETLADRLAKGALSPDQAIKYAIEIATALDAAHRHGIIHRDLKPGNVMLTKTGVKLLDFGLAKLKEVEGQLGQTTMAKGTGIGTLLGTMPYMSPEQVEGRDVDARSDIFSLGTVIYEMVTGQRAFKGDSPASVIGAILKDEPAPMKTLQPLTPAVLDHVVTQCLAKEPDERWQSAADIARELKWISSGAVGEGTRASGTSRWSERALWIAVTAILVATLAGVAFRSRPVAPAGEVVRLSINPPKGNLFTAVPSASIPTPQFALSPDGRSIAFVASVDETSGLLWVRSLADVEARRLPGSEGAQDPFWSPDNSWVGFYDRAGAVKKVPASGGTVQTIAKSIPSPRGASWGVDDTILIGTGDDGLFQVSADGNVPPRPVTVPDRSGEEGSHRWPHFLPGSRRFLFTIRNVLPEREGVYVGSLDDQTKRLLIAANANAQFAAPGALLYLDGDTLLSQSFDPEQLLLSGAPTPVASVVGRNSRGNGAFSVSAAGTLAFAGFTQQTGRLAWIDRRGSSIGVVGGENEHDYLDFRLSPDDRRLAASVVDPKTSISDIWLTDLARGAASKLTFGPQISSGAVWSPNGERIVFRRDRKGFNELYQKSAGAGGADQPLLIEAEARPAGVSLSNLIASDWSPDGKAVAVSAGLPPNIWLVPMDKTRPIRLVGSLSDTMHANFSPNGRFIAYTSNESGRFEVFVETIPASDRKWLISTGGGYEPRWRADGKEIYYLSKEQTLMAVSVSSSAAPFGVPVPLFQAKVPTVVNLFRTHYVPNRDGSRFLMNVRSDDPVPVPITVVLNWTSTLKK